MVYTTEDIDRLMVCPTLFEKEWDYLPIESSVEDRIFNKAIHDIFRWRKRRCADIDYYTLTRSLSTYYDHLRRQGLLLDEDYLFLFEQKIRRFLNEGFLTKMRNPIFNTDFFIDLNKGNKIKIELPLICTLKDKVTIVIMGKKQKFLMTDPKILLSIIWSFYVLDEFPSFLFLTEGKDDLIETIKTTDYQMMLEASALFKKIKKRFIQMETIPNRIICTTCSKEKECHNLIW